MSWGASFKTKGGDIVEETLQESNIESEEHQEQADAVSDVVWDLINSGLFGDPMGEFSVSVSGHGNPGHVPAAGWANDCITINISQLSTS